MKKIIWGLMCASALFISCGDDEDENENSNPQNTNQNTDNGKPEEKPADGSVDGAACLANLKKDYNIDVKLPSTSEISLFSSFTYRWSVVVKSTNTKNDALEVANAIFNQTKTLSTDGLYTGSYDYDETTNKTVFVKDEDITTLDEAMTMGYGEYAQYTWYYKSANGHLTEIFIDFNGVNGEYTIGVN